MQIEAINYSVSDLQFKKTDKQQKTINNINKQITDLPRFSNNQYLVNFKGLEDRNADITLVKQELDSLFSEPEKLINPNIYDTHNNLYKFVNFLRSERDDISKLAFSYLKKEPILLEELTSDSHSPEPLQEWGSGATKALLEYLSDKPKLKEKVLFTERNGYIAGVSALSGPGAKGVWEYFSDKDKEFKEFIIKSKSYGNSSPFFDNHNDISIKILERFKNDDATLRELMNIKSEAGSYIYTPPHQFWHDGRSLNNVHNNVLDVLKWIEKEKPELFKEIFHKADKDGNTIIDLLNFSIRESNKEYPFIEFFADKKDLIKELFLKLVKKEDGKKTLAGINLMGEPLKFALDCVNDNVKVYKTLKHYDILEPFIYGLEAPAIVRFYESIIQDMDKQ